MSNRRLHDRIFLESYSWRSALYVLAPGIVLGEVAAELKHGFSAVTLLNPILLGVGALFIASSHLVAAEKVRAYVLIPIIGCISALVGVSYFAYGISVFLRE